MEVTMSSEEVMLEIQHLNSNEENLNKKMVKKAHPHLMRSALHYFSDWNSAVEKSISVL